MEASDDEVSDGSDTEIENDEEYLMEEEIEENLGHYQRLFDEEHDVLVGILASDSESDGEFEGFQKTGIPTSFAERLLTTDEKGG